MPYSELDSKAFWKLCRASPDFLLSDLYAPKFPIAPGMRVGAAGSCFAQNIARYLKQSDVEFLDVEPAPRGMDDRVARQFGYGLYSARYGNIYTARQLRQLVEDAAKGRVHDCAVWDRDGRYYDALRPGVEPQGLASPEEFLTHRLDHLERVADLIRRIDIFVFTLGLTETWKDAETGVVFPSAPGVIAGEFDPDRFEFVNMSFAEVMDDMTFVLDVLRRIRPGMKFLLTVSPVPLTATATGQHVLAATTYSKSVLRAVAGELARTDDSIDYFPSYEIIAGLPFGTANYGDNLRSVSDQGVAQVMQVFFAAHGLPVPDLAGASARGKRARGKGARDDICEDVLLEAFART